MDETAIRDALDSDAEALAALWHEGWQDAHAAIVPAELAAVRTPGSFLLRVREHLPQIRTSGPAGAPLALCIVDGDELDQIYVSAAARGTGLARRLIDDAERIMAANGVATAWLACAVGNNRAARFYEKCGWVNVGVDRVELKATDPAFLLEIWRFEKRLAR